MRTLTLTTRIACTLINDIVVDIDGVYWASRLGCQLASCEIERPTGAGRPVSEVPDPELAVLKRPVVSVRGRAQT